MTVTIPEWIISNLDFVAYAFLAYGVWKFGKLKPEGFFYAMIGSILLFGWGFYFHHWGTVCWNILFAILYFFAFKNNSKIQKIVNDSFKKEDQ